MTDQKLVDELEKALTDEAYDGGMGSLDPGEFRQLVRTLAVTAAEAVEKAQTSEERDARAEAERRIGSQYTGISGIEEAGLVQLEIDRFVEGAQWAKKAHTPTDDEREALYLIEQAASFREQVRPNVEGFPNSMIGLWMRTASALESVLRRTEVRHD